MIQIKAIVPVAGIGKRLRPHTHTIPKALLYIAGKAILGHILDKVASIGINDVVLIIGFRGEKVKEYVKQEYPNMHFDFAEQKEMLGLGHAIYTAKPYVKENEPILIIYGDTIFVGDISVGKKEKNDGCIGIKAVDDPRSFGVVETKNGKITKLVEKPDYIKPMPAIVGVNFINNSKLLFDSLEELISKNIKTKNEYQLTDAFQLMVEKNAVLTTFPLERWFDCGRPETLLETNRYMLDNLKTKHDKSENSVIIPPVFIDKTAKVKNSIVGPYVSIAAGATVTNSIIKNSILNKVCTVKNAQLTDSLIGENAIVEDFTDKLNVGDNSEIRFSGE
ncbi:MAG: sugar phosphate nucleotidyltransferase [archaeon]